jgi:hypothetical protein
MFFPFSSVCGDGCHQNCKEWLPKRQMKYEFGESPLHNAYFHKFQD